MEIGRSVKDPRRLLRDKVVVSTQTRIRGRRRGTERLVEGKEIIMTVKTQRNN